MPLRRVYIPSPNHSSRGGSGVRLCIVHTAEGANGFRNLGAFFANPNAQVSSHVGIDDERGVIGEYVARPDKAWTQANFNPQCVSAELCASPLGVTGPCGANWPRAEWMRHDAMLANVADWIREECQHYGLPIAKLSTAQAQGSGRGVAGHVDLGAGGGGHYDPGPNFPWAEVMDLARGGSPAPPQPSRPKPKPKPPPSAPKPPASKAPPFPGTVLVNFTQGHGTKTWQQQMKNRGWTIGVDDKYGGESEQVCRSFQAEKHLTVDGKVGPATWNAAWAAPVT